MKIRTNFVSNSSSSSFILSFPEKITCVEQLRKFVDIQAYEKAERPSFFVGEKPSLETVLASVLTKISKQENIEELCDEMLDADAWDFVEMMQDHQISLKELKHKSLLEILREHAKTNTYYLEYSDDSSFGCWMEHYIMPTIFGKYLIERESHH